MSLQLPSKLQDILSRNDLSSLQSFFSSQKPEKSLLNLCLLYSIRTYTIANDTKEIVEFLLSQGAYRNATDPEGKTPLMLASEKGYLELVHLVISLNPDVNKQDSKGRTALFLAVDTPAENSDIVSILAEKTDISSINAKTMDGSTALLKACERGFEHSVGILLRHGADPSLSPSKADTPLHIVLKKRNLPIFSLLLEAGANLNSRNAEGLSPMDLITQDNDLHLILLSFMAKEKSRKEALSIEKEKDKPINKQNKFLEVMGNNEEKKPVPVGMKPQKGLLKNLSMDNLPKGLEFVGASMGGVVSGGFQYSPQQQISVFGFEEGFYNQANQNIGNNNTNNNNNSSNNVNNTNNNFKTRGYKPEETSFEENNLMLNLGLNIDLQQKMQLLPSLAYSNQKSSLNFNNNHLTKSNPYTNRTNPPSLPNFIPNFSNNNNPNLNNSPNPSNNNNNNSNHNNNHPNNLNLNTNPRSNNNPRVLTLDLTNPNVLETLKMTADFLNEEKKQRKMNEELTFERKRNEELQKELLEAKMLIKAKEFDNERLFKENEKLLLKKASNKETNTEKQGVCPMDFRECLSVKDQIKTLKTKALYQGFISNSNQVEGRLHEEILEFQKEVEVFNQENHGLFEKLIAMVTEAISSALQDCVVKD